MSFNNNNKILEYLVNSQQSNEKVYNPVLNRADKILKRVASLEFNRSSFGGGGGVGVAPINRLTSSGSQLQLQSQSPLFQSKQQLQSKPVKLLQSTFNKRGEHLLISRQPVQPIVYEDDCAQCQYQKQIQRQKKLIEIRQYNHNHRGGGSPVLRKQHQQQPLTDYHQHQYQNYHHMGSLVNKGGGAVYPTPTPHHFNMYYSKGGFDLNGSLSSSTTTLSPLQISQSPLFKQQQLPAYPYKQYHQQYPNIQEGKQFYYQTIYAAKNQYYMGNQQQSYTRTPEPQLYGERRPNINHPKYSQFK